MSVEEPPAPTEPPQPQPTTVVGYPDQPPAAPRAEADALRSQVRSIRTLVAACLILLVVLAVGVAAGLAMSQSRMDQLSDQVAALGQQVESARAAAAAPAAPSAAAQQPAAEETVKQLGPATDLAPGTIIPAGADTTGAILIGDPAAKDVVEVYIDYQCPFCQRWEEQFGTALVQKALQPGSGLLVKQYNLAFLGETSADLSPAGASARAASAAACVLDADGPDTFAAFSTSLFATADPNEPPGQFTVKVLTSLAKEAGASPTAVTCIENEQNVPFVAATTQSGFGRGVGGTPTVIVNGRTLGNPFTDQAIADLLGPS